MIRHRWPGIEYEGALFIVDNDAPTTAMRFLHWASVRRYVLRNWFWDNRTGSIWERINASDGRDTEIFKALMYTRQQLITVRNNTHGEIYGTAATT